MEQMILEFYDGSIQILSLNIYSFLPFQLLTMEELPEKSLYDPHRPRYILFLASSFFNLAGVCKA